MAANLPRPSSVENVSTTLSSGITDVDVTMTVADASNIVSPCYLVVDRVDSGGTLKSTSLWEYVKVTNVSGNDLTISRGQNSSTQQSHSSGAVVEAVVTSAMFEDWYTALNPEHTASGGHIMGTATVNYLQGFNLAITSVASVTTLNSTTGSINTLTSTTHLNASGASTTGLGLGLFPTFVMAQNASAATVSWGKPLAMPRAGDFRFVSVTLRAPASGCSLFFDVNKNFASLFDSGTRPTILGGGTFVSTASLATKTFKAGDVISVDLDAGGNFSDAVLTLASY